MGPESEARKQWCGQEGWVLCYGRKETAAACGFVEGKDTEEELGEEQEGGPDTRQLGGGPAGAAGHHEPEEEHLPC